MCVIVWRPAGKTIPDFFFTKAIAANNDGFGLMYKEDDVIKVIKRPGPLKYEEVMKIINDLGDINLSMHFRMRTHGDLSENNCHPYPVTRKEDGDPHDIYVMHNGVISNTGAERDKGESDTAMYIAKILRPIVKENPGLLGNKSFMEMVSRDIGTGNRFLISHTVQTPFLWTLNFSQGNEKWGCWFSNSNHLYETYEYGGVKPGGPFPGKKGKKAGGGNTDTKSVSLYVPGKKGGVERSSYPFHFRGKGSSGFEGSYPQLRDVSSRLDKGSIRELLLTGSQSPQIPGNALELYHLNYLKEHDLERIIKNNPNGVLDLLMEISGFRFKEPPDFRQGLVEDTFSAGA